MKGTRPSPTRTRTLTPEEAEIISRPQPGSLGCIGWVGLAMAGWLLGSLTYIILCLKFGYGSWIESGVFLPVIFGLSIVCGALGSFLQSRFTRKPAKRTNDVVKSEIVEIFAFNPIDAIRIEEFEDEGSQYFLRLQDGRVLWIIGQFLYDYEENGIFPCTDFDVECIRSSGTVLGLKCRGTRLLVSKNLGSLRWEVLEVRANDWMSMELAIIDVPWAEIKSRLKPAR